MANKSENFKKSYSKYNRQIRISNLRYFHSESKDRAHQGMREMAALFMRTESNNYSLILKHNQRNTYLK